MTSLFASNYLSRRPIERAMAVFGAEFRSDETVVDLGCGSKPYQHLFTCTYLGVDPFPGTASDIAANAWEVPLPDGIADGVVLNQSLEHIPRTVETVAEVWRLLKPGGRVFVSVPQAMRVHGTPVPLGDIPIRAIPASIATVWKDDYFRFTKYGLLYLFRAFKPLLLTETRTTVSTLIQHGNYFVAALGLGALPVPFYVASNLLALAVDGCFGLLRRLPFPVVARFDELVLRGLTVDYVFVAQKPHEVPDKEEA